MERTAATTEVPNRTQGSDEQAPLAHNQELGARGEALAAEYLEGLGYRILERNWRIRGGELDLIALESGTVVAVEVKTRSGDGYGSPFAAITARKAARLRRLLLDWVRSHEVGAGRLRIDAVAITLRSGASPRIEHLRGIA
ncbi:YraN family protein [Leucobacter sp. USHLN153]|uniref:YraN family protein n=1 Tax=Leucobacter sp. USHLN153 TaxID=3081268 RepID=UPI003016C35B